jgi:hypothetical protein
MAPHWRRPHEGNMWRIQAVWPEMPTMLITFDASAWRMSMEALEVESWTNDQVQFLPTSTPLFLRCEEVRQ